MARNRKRAKERRSRRTAESAVSRRGLAAARAERDDLAPAPLEHASPDVELADAQLAVGRPELVDEPQLEPEPAAPDGEGGDGVPGGSFESDAVAPPARMPAPRVGAATRLVHFLQGSWRELQRVQWPDRRQVVQATSVVIGFVIVAGVYLGVADAVASRIMDFVLK